MSHVSGTACVYASGIRNLSYYIIFDIIQNHVLIVYCFYFTVGKVLVFSFFDSGKQVCRGYKMVKLTWKNLMIATDGELLNLFFSFIWDGDFWFLNIKNHPPR